MECRLALIRPISYNFQSNKWYSGTVLVYSQWTISFPQGSTSFAIVTSSFSINFRVNIMILSCKFCVYLYFTPLFTSWRIHELCKRQGKFL